MPKYIKRIINPRKWMKKAVKEKFKTVEEITTEEEYIPASGSFSAEEVESKSRHRKNRRTETDKKD